MQAITEMHKALAFKSEKLIENVAQKSLHTQDNSSNHDEKLNSTRWLNLLNCLWQSFFPLDHDSPWLRQKNMI